MTEREARGDVCGRSTTGATFSALSFAASSNLKTLFDRDSRAPSRLLSLQLQRSSEGFDTLLQTTDIVHSQEEPRPPEERRRQPP
jgi:hypothetical protein